MELPADVRNKGKWWGDRSRQPVVALHGVQDNAATFDRLCPLLPGVDSLLSLDLPGHGHSSHLHSGITVHFLDNVTFLRHILVDHFRWKEPLRFLGHSFGSAVLFAYAALYAEEVDRYCSIDCGRYNLIPELESTVEELRTLLDWQLETETWLESGKPSPEYRLQQLVELMVENRKPPMDLNEEACRVILSRGTQVSTVDPEKVRLSRDVRLKRRAFGRMCEQFIYALSERVRCRVLYLTCTEGIVATGHKREVHRTSLAITERTAASFESLTVQGKHHVHLEHPERVAHHVDRFLSN